MLFLAFFLLVAGTAGEEKGKMEEWIKQAWEKNPEISALQAEYEAKLSRIPAVKTLPDPQVGIMLQNEGSGFSLGMMPMSMFGFSASQMFPYPGKLSLMGEMAYWEARMTYYQLLQAKNRLRAQVKKTLYDIALAQRLKEIYSEMKTLVKSLSETVAGMYVAGMVPQQDIFVIQSQIYEIEQNILEQERRERELLAEFSDLLCRSILPDSLSFPLPDELILPPLAEELYDMTKKFSPMLGMEQANIEMKDSGIRLAEKEFKPDAMVMVGYAFRSISLGPVWSAGAQISVPFYKKTKQEKLLKEAEWKFTEAEKRFKVSENFLLSQIDAMRASITLLHQQLGFLHDVQLPQASLTLESSFSAYISGKVNLMTHLDNLMQLYELQMEKAMKLAMGWKDFADLEEMVGTTLEKKRGEER